MAFNAHASLLLLLVVPAMGSAQPQGGALEHSAWSPGSSSIAEAEIIPTAYRGRWAPNTTECNDQDGVQRLSVSAFGIETYESGGRLERITSTGQDRSVKLKLSYEGEGNFWDAVEIWKLSERGDRLVMSNEKGASPTMLIKCD